MSIVPKHIYRVAELLSTEYGDFAHHNKKNPLDELLFIYCSIRTDVQVYLSVYGELKRRFPSFTLLADAKVSTIERILRPSGLSRKRAQYIVDSLRIICQKFGKPSLTPLRKMTDTECEDFLMSLPNAGKKVARCVMMYSLGRAVFPVDTHCWRMSRRLGWIRQTRKNNACPPRDMDRLQDRIPTELRYSLHVNMVSHGRSICIPASPKCSCCILRCFCQRVGVRD